MYVGSDYIYIWDLTSKNLLSKVKIKEDVVDIKLLRDDKTLIYSTPTGIYKLGQLKPLLTTYRNKFYENKDRTLIYSFSLFHNNIIYCIDSDTLKVIKKYYIDRDVYNICLGSCESELYVLCKDGIYVIHTGTGETTNKITLRDQIVSIRSDILVTRDDKIYFTTLEGIRVLTN